jgi:hypothetical protein
MFFRFRLSFQPCGVHFLGSLEAPLDQVDLAPWRFDSVLRFLLKGVEHVNAASQSHGVDGAICVPGMVFNDLQNAGSAEPSEGLRIGMLSALLCHVERKAHGILDVLWKTGQVRLCAPNPNDRLNSGVKRLHHVMPKRA